jgi:hypothetical protein
MFYYYSLRSKDIQTHRHPIRMFSPSLVHLPETRITQALQNVLLQTGCPDLQKFVLIQNPQFEHEGWRLGGCWSEKRVSISTYYVSGKIPRGCHHELRLRNGYMRCLEQLPISCIK